MDSSKARPPKGEPWVHREYLRDNGKSRVFERYWQSFLDRSSKSVLDTTKTATLGVRSSEEDGVFVIPDAVCWRKFLRFFKYVLTNTVEPSSRWFLLESVVEHMDYRNQSPVIQQTKDDTVYSICEMAAPQERSTMQKLVQEGHLLPYCDLSMRQFNHFDRGAGDEFHWLQYPDLPIERRSQHALLRAARFLQIEKRKWVGNMGATQTVIILVENASDKDWENLRMDPGIQVQSISEFMKSIANGMGNKEKEQCDFLINLCEEEYDRRHSAKIGEATTKQEAIYEYLSEEAVDQGLRGKTLFCGRLNVTTDNTKEAFVRVNGKHWFVDLGRGHHNRAFHQDIVVIAPLPENQWGRPVGRRRLVFQNDNSKDDENDLDSNEIDPSYPTFPSARVVAINTASRRSFVATMVDIPLKDESAILLVPMDVRIPKIRVHTRSFEQFVNQRLLVQIDTWEIGSNYPKGHILEVLGSIGDVETEIKCLLCENQVRLEPFSLAAKALLPSEDWKISSMDTENRRDLRHLNIFSVDPVGCQDIDDTMHARKLDNGDVEIGVHIADVTHFVPLDSALDREARIRGTTFYLVDRRFDMLPSVLSSNVCSLHGKTDRLAVSVIWTLSSDLETIKSIWYGRTIIHSVAAMTYEQAANILDGRAPDKPGAEAPPPLTAGAPVDSHLIPNLKQDLFMLQTIARNRRKKREEVGGAVDLSSGDLGSELKFTIVNGKPTAVKPKEDLEIHHTIAEMMIWANTSVASKIFERFPGSSLLRIHQEVEEDRFDDLKEMLTAGNFKLQGKTNMELAESLKSAENKTTPVVASLFRSLATRAMSEALYVSTGDVKDGKTLSHYGLGLSQYTHFTSPIRRYADVVVHHQLLASLSETPPRQIPSSSKRKETAALPESALMSVLHGEHQHTVCAAKDPYVLEKVKGFNDEAERTPVDSSRNDASPDEVTDEDLEIENLIGGSCDDLLGEENINDVSEEEQSSNGCEDLEIDDLIGNATDMIFEESPLDTASPDNDSESASIDSLIADVETNHLSSYESPQEEIVEHANSERTEQAKEDPDIKNADEYSSLSFAGKQVSVICERLNLHNRLAKQCSFDCQNLFLSLFFKDHAITVEAVVANLRENGFVAYVPRFDIRAPVYLRDSDGYVQMDPALLDLPEDYGSEPTIGFAWSRFCRRYQKSEAQLSLSGGERLDVIFNGQRRMNLKPLDVVQVQIFSSDWDQRARIPQPRLHLVNSTRANKRRMERATSPNTSETKQEVKVPMGNTFADSLSLFDVIQLAKDQGVDHDVEKNLSTKSSTSRTEQVRGRIVFGSFENPSTMQAAQRLAQEEAAAEAKVRRNNAIQQISRREDVVNTRRIEREVTMRQQRLEKQKFQSRRAKRQ